MEQKNKETSKRKIIFAKWVMLGLMQLGFNPIETLPNPMNNKFLCWSFEDTDAFELALSQVLGCERHD